ncbi:hypothetical protein ABOM_009087 [Aspergillus bombycis]|uniref:Uncharacterized protein n=1 Tax=Aspergillus bombycis TaxID=109264 RepID=A0A1F7ZT58_9EURO|nr:hypothetical protein ABOM_009087 [Aspergillus bombycis]OGM42268.1 hypothetical protein ABOM_009087 [Aspergillus bombycis]
MKPQSTPMQPVGHRLIGYPPDRREDCVRRITERSRGVVSFHPVGNMYATCLYYYTVLYQNWDIADRRFWIAWHWDYGNGRTGGLDLN